MPILILNKNAQGLKVFRFFDSITIGRDVQNDVVLNDPNDFAVSRMHAYIRFENGHYVLHDKSSNGTFVNDQNISTYVLAHGIRFTIIDNFFTFIDDYESEMIPEFQAVEAFTDESIEDVETAIIKIPVTEEKSETDYKARLRQEGIVVSSPKMIALYNDIQAVADINVPVLIEGEPGTGKEKVAQTLHRHSKVKGEFVALNCSAIPEGIFESELFGSVRGAFHNATDKPGKLELANNGTIFLDEIGDMSVSLQPKLLRFLEDKKVVRLGDTQVRKLNVRVVAATNQDLKTMMQQRNFREDLYQRLSCINLKIPPLKERKEDIITLAEFFLEKFSKEHHIGFMRLSNEAKGMLMGYHWPGNVRELGNVLLSAAVRNRGTSILYPAHLTAASDNLRTVSMAPSKPFPSLKDMEKNHIVDALERAGWNKLQAAKLLGISRDTLYKKLQKYEIEEPEQ